MTQENQEHAAKVEYRGEGSYFGACEMSGERGRRCSDGMASMSGELLAALCGALYCPSDLSIQLDQSLEATPSSTFLSSPLHTFTLTLSSFSPTSP